MPLAARVRVEGPVKDPRRSVAIWLPGRATHYETHTRESFHAACGSSSMERTDQIDKVTCRRCLRTKKWVEAWDRYLAFVENGE
jgi:hypothetical protein